jgi:hypothetical protein
MRSNMPTEECKIKEAAIRVQEKKEMEEIRSDFLDNLLYAKVPSFKKKEQLKEEAITEYEEQAKEKGMKLDKLLGVQFEFSEEEIEAFLSEQEQCIETLISEDLAKYVSEKNLNEKALMEEILASDPQLADILKGNRLEKSQNSNEGENNNMNFGGNNNSGGGPNLQSLGNSTAPLFLHKISSQGNTMQGGQAPGTGVPGESDRRVKIKLSRYLKPAEELKARSSEENKEIEVEKIEMADFQKVKLAKNERTYLDENLNRQQYQKCVRFLNSFNVLIFFPMYFIPGLFFGNRL